MSASGSPGSSQSWEASPSRHRSVVLMRSVSVGAAEPTPHMQPVESARLGGRPAIGDSSRWLTTGARFGHPVARVFATEPEPRKDRFGRVDAVWFVSKHEPRSARCGRTKLPDLRGCGREPARRQRSRDPPLDAGQVSAKSGKCLKVEGSACLLRSRRAGDDREGSGSVTAGLMRGSPDAISFLRVAARGSAEAALRVGQSAAVPVSP